MLQILKTQLTHASLLFYHCVRVPSQIYDFQIFIYSFQIIQFDSLHVIRNYQYQSIQILIAQLITSRLQSFKKIEIYRINYNMSYQSNSNNNLDIPSLFSSSICIDQFSIKNQPSFKVLNSSLFPNKYQTEKEVKSPQVGSANYDSEVYIDLELKRCTSFQEIFMENHRNVLISSIMQYFQKTNHSALTLIGADKKNTFQKLNQVEVEVSWIELCQTIQKCEYLAQGVKDVLKEKIRKQEEIMKLISDLMTICPKEIQPDIMLLLNFILIESEALLDHFQKKKLKQQINRSSGEVTKKLQQTRHNNGEPCIFSDGSHPNHLSQLVQKWLYTIFLMKIGVFENNLETKSIQQCLSVESLKAIHTNDLINLHLLKPHKKVKKQ